LPSAAAAASALLFAVAAFAGEAPAFRVFARSPLDLVSPESPPAEGEAEAAVLKLAAAPGEFEPAVFTVRTAKAIKGFRIAATELKGPKGSAIPASCVRLQRVLPGRFQVGPKDKRREVVVPEWLVPAEDVADLAQDRNETFWIVVRVPDDAPAGKYAGAVSALAEGCEPREIGIELAVRPFRLAPPTATFAMLYTY